MKLFKHSSGMLISFGFNMIARRPDDIIAWSDVDGVTWEMRSDNQAGFFSTASCRPEFVHEAGDRKIVAYQPGLCLEMIMMGQPLIWGFNFLRSETIL